MAVAPTDDFDLDFADPPAPPASRAQPSSQSSGKKIDYYGAKAKDLIAACIKDSTDNTTRLDRDQQDILNLLMHRGGEDSQWVVWDQTSNTYTQRPYDGDAGLPEYVPRAVSNVFANKIDGITALQVQTRPTLQFAPATDDDDDRATATVCGDALPALLEEIGYDDGLRAQIAQLRTLTDKVAVCYAYDTDEKYGVDEVPMLRCPNPECGVETTAMMVEDAGDVCPECQATPADLMEPVLDDHAQPLGVQYAKGKIVAEVIPSVEFSLPRAARRARADKNPWVLTHTRMPEPDAIRQWSKFKDVIRGASTDSRSGMQRQYADQVARLSSPRSARQGAAGAGGGHGSTLGPIVYRLQHDPIDTEEYHFPEGLFAVMIGGEIVEAGPLPVVDDQGNHVKSILITTYREWPNSCYGKPPADDLVPLQIQRNLVETLLLLILMHDAAPRTFVPLSVTMEDEITGAPGGVYRYRSLIPGEKPVTERGMNPPEGLYKFLEMIDTKFEQLSNMNAVLQGSRPEGDPTLGEIQILQEQGQAAFRVPLDNLAAFERDQAIMLLRIARRSMWSPRFRQIEGENGGWLVKQFAGADLAGHVNVLCDPATAWPHSPLLQSLRRKDAIEAGILQPMADPELAAKMLEQMDLSDLKPSLDVDRKQITRHLDEWKAAKDPTMIRPINPAVDNLALHLHFKQQFLKTEEVEELQVENAPVYQAMVMHVLSIQQILAQQAMAQAATQAGPQKPGKEPSPAESGSSNLESHVQSGELTPAGPEQGPGPALEGAVQSGQLIPAGAMPQPMLPSIDDLIAQGAMTPVIPQAGQPGGLA